MTWNKCIDVQRVFFCGSPQSSHRQALSPRLCACHYTLGWLRRGPGLRVEVLLYAEWYTLLFWDVRLWYSGFLWVQLKHPILERIHKSYEVLKGGSLRLGNRITHESQEVPETSHRHKCLCHQSYISKDCLLMNSDQLELPERLFDLLIYM